MNILYFISIQFYVLSVRIASLFNAKARLWIRGRRAWKEKLVKNIIPGEKYAWIHCASLGEFEQGRPVIEEIKQQFPHLKIVLTFFSPSGYEIRKNYPLTDIIAYLPADTPSNARFFVKTVKPEFSVFVKYEFWYYFISSLYRQKVPVYLVSSIFRPGQIFFRWYGKWYIKMLKMFTGIFVQDKNSLELLKSTGVEKVVVAGDTRYDRVWEIFNKSKRIDEVSEFSEDSFTIVCGSTWQPDDEILIKWLHQAPAEVKLIIATHEIQESRLTWLESQIRLPCVRFSQYKNGGFKNKRVLIIDNIGMLSSLYGYGKMAYVGGGFGKGIHNILEAAVYGIPVVFGPDYHRFGEAVELISEGGAFPVSGYEDLGKIFNKFLGDPANLAKASGISGEFVKKRIGATSIFISFLNNELYKK